MDFFARQNKARKKTGLLIFLFAVAVLALILAIYFVAVPFFGMGSRFMQGEGSSWWQPELLIYTALGTLCVVGAGIFMKLGQLSHGGGVVAEMLGGRLIIPDTSDPQERRLRNVVEEMSIASGIAVPQVYLMDDEEGINAFAAGYSPGDAAVSVTRGCLEQLNRQELEGVVAHEFSHVLNGDMRLNIRLMAVLHGILCISMAGLAILRYQHTQHLFARYRPQRNSSFVAAAVFGFALYIIGYLGVFFGKVIKAAVSRQREFLADASAVQFTRNPLGLGHALMKIAGYAHGTTLHNSHAEEASHMLFMNGVSGWFSGLLATHPPIEDRITALDPHVKLAQRRAGMAQATGTGDARITGLHGGTSVDNIMQSVGQLTPELVAHGRNLLSQLPLVLATAVREPFSARAVVYCLLLNPEHGSRRKQLKLLHEIANPQTAAETLHLQSEFLNLDPALRLPLLDLTLPALRSMSKDQYREFRENVKAITPDAQANLFGFTLEKALLRHLDSAYDRVHVPPIRYRRPGQLLDECGTLLSVLAHGGHDNSEDTKAAYDQGLERLLKDTKITAERRPPLTEKDACRLGTLEDALDHIAMASPDLKRRVLGAMAVAIATDGKLLTTELELLRAVADTIDCPLPPIPVGSSPAQA